MIHHLIWYKYMAKAERCQEGKEKKSKELEILEIQLELNRINQQIVIAKDENPAIGFRPFPHQQQILDAIQDPRYLQIVLQGSNQIGKTAIGAVITNICTNGYEAWSGRKGRFNPPVKIRIIGSEWEHHVGQVLVPKLKEWLPRGSYKTTKNNIGAECFFHFNNGSIIEFLTHDQKDAVHESWTGHMVWADEPLPRDKYAGNIRGLIVNNGIFLITMTALTEPWIRDEIVLRGNADTFCVLDVPMSANPTITAEQIANYESKLTPEEAYVRVHGGWLHLTGLVVPEFSRARHFIEPIDLPKDCPYVAMIDPHLRELQAISYHGWVFEGDDYNQYQVDETWYNLSPEEIAGDIIAHKVKGMNLVGAYIDPFAKGDSKYMKNRGDVEDTYTIVERKLYAFGIPLFTASKDKPSGIKSMRSGFKRDKLFIFNTCRQTCKELESIIYDESGKPRKVNDHFFENLYRSRLIGNEVKYASQFHTHKAFEMQGIV